MECRAAPAFPPLARGRGIGHDVPMPFAFKPSEAQSRAGVRTGLRRIARAELAAALRLLEAGPPGPETVHDLRRHTKKLRGLIRLVAPVFPQFGPVNRALRDGARHLAALRDAEVRLATLRCLRQGLDDPAPAEPAARALAAELLALRAPEAMAEATEGLGRELAALRAGVGDWTLGARGWAALSPGLRATWRAARAGQAASARAWARGDGAAPFHEWRKSVKHHWFQARLLAPIWPEMLAPQIDAADTLAEDLGAHNDIDVLLARLAADPDPEVAGLAASGPFAQAARAARQELAGRAVAQGARLLTERPGALARRWGAWWDLWRAEAADGR